MTTIELARIVANMRACQRTYFAERTGENLERAKDLERKVDRVVKEILQDKPATLPGCA